MENFKYDAFISYRHCDLDKFVATNLHKILETYNLPKDIKEKLNINHKAFKRVFRDQEELPLTSNLEDPIIEALKESKYLIVICSPRLNDSLWCKKEIETFKKLRGRKNIFCVLIEGEPKDSFPDEVLSDEEGNLVEPLAADVRGKNKRTILKKLKEEKLRLIAPMYNLDYDDLRQRHKIWKQKRIIHTSLLIALACILFTIYSIAMFIKINTQQNVLAEYHALSLVQEANDYLLKDDRYNAIKLSYQSLTNFHDIKMPYTSLGEYTLSESLGVYDVGLSYKAIDSLEVDGIVEHIKSSNDYKYSLIFDGSDKLTLIDTKTLKKIFEDEISSFDKYKYTFVGNDKFAYVNKKGNINLVNIDGSLIKEIEKEVYSFRSLLSDSNGKYLIYLSDNDLYIYDVENNKELTKINSKQKYINDLYISFDSKYLFCFSKDTVYDLSEETLNIHVIDLDKLKEINKTSISAGFINGLTVIDDNVYFLFNSIVDTKFYMVLVSYNYITNTINWTKKYENKWGNFIKKSYPKENHIAVALYNNINIYDINNGDLIEVFNVDSKIIELYSFLNKELYLAFLEDGSVNYISMEAKDTIELLGKYEFNVDSYNYVIQSTDGYILVPSNDNRVILYEEKYNDELIKENIKLDYVGTDSISSNKFDPIKEEYNLKNKSLVVNIFYDTDQKILFVNYNNGDLSIYDVESKKLINSIEKLGKANHYFGKDKFNRIYIGDSSNSYILDKGYNKVGHIKGLAKLESDKVIIGSDDNYYSLKIYSYKELLNKAKEILKDDNDINN